MKVLIADVLKLKIIMLDSQICIIFIMTFVFSGFRFFKFIPNSKWTNLLIWVGSEF